MKKRYSLLLMLLVLPAMMVAQELRLAPFNGTAGTFVNAQLAADTAANGGVILPTRVYVLTRGAPYASNATFRVNTGQTIRMRANDSTAGGKPVIFLYPTGTGGSPQNPPGNFIDLRGNLEFKNLVLSGYYEPIDTNLFNLQGGLINVPVAGAGANIKVDSCVFTNSNGNHIRTDGAVKNVVITNSVFANMGYLGRSNLGAGKGIDLRDVSADTVVFENCTFVNWQDRIIRHYNFSNPLAGTGPIHYLRFNHNTLVNGMSYHGFLSLGSMGKRAIITNNLLIDPFSLGNDTDAVRQAEFVNHGELNQYGSPRMPWIFTAPNDSTQWTIAKNHYVISDSGQAFYNDFAAAGVTGEGSPLTYHINGKLGIDSTTAFTKVTGLVLAKTPALMSKLNRWYRWPSGGNKTKNTPNAAIWNASFDFDRKGWQYFRDSLNCSYSTSSLAYTGAELNYPAGDLNWFPWKMSQWLQGGPAGVEAGGTLPTSFSMSQNFPNPFNPSTTITYGVPMESKITIEVFDLLGRKLATLVNEVKQVGVYSVDFDGSKLASGIYLYKLSTPAQTITKKMTFVK